MLRKLTHQNLRFPVLILQADAPCSEFVAFWKAQFDYPMQAYQENIYKKPFHGEDIKALFAWKNGMTLSFRKAASLERILDQLHIINRLQEQFDEELFAEHFGYLRPVWQIFLRHIIQPGVFPIFDQHVYRAMRYLGDFEQEQTGSALLQVYTTYYQPFFSNFQADCRNIPTKDIDAALWSFGKFLNLYPNLLPCRNLSTA